MFGPKMNEVTGERMKLHNEDLHKADQVKENEEGGTRGPHATGEESVQCFGGKTRRKETARKTKA
jgi:hypothetical protein